MLTHQTNAQKFHCTYCPTVLTRKADLKQHMIKKHANDEDFVTCLKCNQEFADPYVLFHFVHIRFCVYFCLEMN
jgi:RNase P subunit RPR2